MGVIISILKNLFIGGVSPTSRSKNTEDKLIHNFDPSTNSSETETDMTAIENFQNKDAENIKINNLAIVKIEESNLSKSISKSDLDLVSSCAKDVFQNVEETQDFIDQMNRKLEEVDNMASKNEPQSPIHEDDLNLVKSCAEEVFNDETKTKTFMLDLNSKLSSIKNSVSNNIYGVGKQEFIDDVDKNSDRKSNFEKNDLHLVVQDQENKLRAINKTRIKGSVKRRPPSRRLLKNLQQMNNTVLHIMDEDIAEEEEENADSKATEESITEVSDSNTINILPKIDKNAFMADLNKRLSMRKVFN